jgi:hypothetical protein
MNSKHDTDPATWYTPDLNMLSYTTGLYCEFGTIKEQLDRWNKTHIDYNRSFKKIAFIGDSYCADLTSDNKDKENRYSSWPELVAKQVNAEILQIGFGGLGFVSSFYNAYVRHHRNLDPSEIGQTELCPGRLSVLERADIIIVCISAPDRLPNRHGFAFGPAQAVRPDRSIIPKKYLKACQLYYENMYFSNFHYIAQKGAIRELDDIVFEGTKKPNQIIVWLPCFEDCMCDYEPKSGVIGDAPLFDLFQRDATKLNKDISRMIDEGIVFRQDPSVSNHMMKETQEQLANHILNYIDNKKEFDLLTQHGASRYTLSITDILHDN